MDRNYVTSSNVRSIGYDPTSGTLEVEFNNSFVYQYYGVPTHVYEALMAAPSKGQFINSQIKNMYGFSRV
jgi:hypothetical protein